MNIKKCELNCAQNCVECNSTMVLPNNQINQINHQLHSSINRLHHSVIQTNSATSPEKNHQIMKQTRLDQVGNSLDSYITEVENSSPLNSLSSSGFTRQSSMRSSKSSQNIQQFQKSKQKQHQLDYYQKIILNNQANENQLYYSFLRLYVDSLSGYTNQEIWHMVKYHNPRIKQFVSGLLIRLPKDTWFIIVTGSVYINGKLYLPHSW